MELAELQDREVGDGTTSVVIIAAELLKVMERALVAIFSCLTSFPAICAHTCCSVSFCQRANELVRNKIHPTSIISGYRVSLYNYMFVAVSLPF